MSKRYEILDLLATGGMAEIYRARSIGAGGFEKPVVVKKILPNFTSDPEFVRMFIEEAKLAAELHHGNIVHVFDLGTTASGEYFIVMELVHGHDLGDLLHDATRQGLSIGLGEAIYIARQVCAGLDYAHRKLDAEGRSLRIIHRDVSPQNVLLSFEGEVKLTDFGIAKARSRTQQTQVGFLKGKYGYMSPEQARGEHLDQRSDLFNVGILLYEMLAGERLFQGSNDFSTLNQMRNVEMVPIERLCADLPERLVSIVHRALAPGAGDRFQSAAELDKALARLSFETSLVMSAGDLAALMERVYGRPSSKPGEPGATRVIDLQALPVGGLDSAPGTDGVGRAGDWDDDLPLAPTPGAHGPEGPARPATVSVQPARRLEASPPAASSGLTRILPPLPPWARGLATLGVAGLAFLLGLALLWPWGRSEAAARLPVGGAVSLPAATAPRYLLIDSRPAGATVVLGDATRARATPALLQWEAGDEGQQVVLRKAGRRAFTGSAPAPADEVITVLEAALPPRQATVRIRTRPSKATLNVNGKAVGKSPHTLTLEPGRHRILARKRGLQMARADIEIPLSPPGGEAPGEERLLLTLPEKGGTGTLRLESYPPATARVGGRIVETGPRGVALELPVGAHRLEVEAAPLPPRQLEVEVRPGQETRVFVDLVLSSPRP
ncbi:MAG: protein kinase [Deltaproteobacteria bacterium]|nr:protein kinase [Deltaproteobacteria bacterium]